MTKDQRQTVDLLLSQGFKITEDIERGTRMSKGSDLRVVKTDGSQRRAQHKGAGMRGLSDEKHKNSGRVRFVGQGARPAKI